MDDGPRLPGRTLYLHFLDRELVEAVGSSMDAETLDRALRILTLATDASLYCGISVIWEHTLLDDRSRQALVMLTRGGALHPISYSSTMEAFLASRRELYKHDADRYPAYFREGIEVVSTIVPSDYKWERTTDHLEQVLGGWSFERTEDEAGRLARSTALHALMKRDTEAITFAYFAPFLRKDGRRHGDAEGVLSRQISIGYADHYLQFSDGDIPTGVRGLAFFDATLAVEFPLHDVPLLAQVVRAAGLGPLLRRPMADDGERWEALLEGRGWGVHARLVRLIRLVLWIGATVVAAAPKPPSSQFAARQQIWGFLLPYLRPEARSAARDLAVERQLEEGEKVLQAAVARLSRNPRLAGMVEEARRLLLTAQADVVLVTATHVETTALLDVLRSACGCAPRRQHIGDKTYLDMGAVAGAQVYVVQTEMGSGGPSGSTLTVLDAISALGPTAAIMVGIAFGVVPSAQGIGDVLVSRQVLSYELHRVGVAGGEPTPVLRGDRVSASPRLLDRCRSAALDWHERPVRFGLLLSGEKVVDNVEVRDRLVELAGGEVVGGEMEGAGLYASAHRRKVDWIVVKAICDWADGRKEVRSASRQATAATNAARFVAHVLMTGGLA